MTTPTKEQLNDRFRFRIWSVREKEMIYNAEIAYDGTNYSTEWQLGENNNDGWICCFGEYIDRKEDYKVMQCTGLKDKNGKLIYEGDIVKEKIFNTDIAVIKFGNGSGFQCFYPEWKGEYSKETKYNPGFRKDLYFWINRKEGLEVVGNIHENPELLEDK